MHDVFEIYLHALRQDRDDKTELSDRGALETLLNAAAKDATPKIRIIHEAKKVRGKGGPDRLRCGAQGLEPVPRWLLPGCRPGLSQAA